MDFLDSCCCLQLQVCWSLPSWSLPSKGLWLDCLLSSSASVMALWSMSKYISNYSKHRVTQKNLKLLCKQAISFFIFCVLGLDWGQWCTELWGLVSSTLSLLALKVSWGLLGWVVYSDFILFFQLRSVYVQMSTCPSGIKGQIANLIWPTKSY